MANTLYVTTCRSPFVVKNPDEFEQTLRKYGLTKESEKSSEGLYYSRNKDKFLIYGYAELPLWDSDKEEYVQIEKIIQPHLTEGTVCVLREVCWTKCRYDSGGGLVLIITKDVVKLLDLHVLTEKAIKSL